MNLLLNYVVKLEKAFAEIRDNYPKELAMVDQGQHLRERFYQGLRKEIHQKLTPSYEDRRIPYVVLIKRARQLEAEFYPKEEIAAKGATTDDPQMQDVLKTLRGLKDQMQQKITPEPSQKTKWKGYGCYTCGEPGHWRKTCPQRTSRKRRPPDPGGGTTTPTSDRDDSND